MAECNAIDKRRLSCFRMKPQRRQNKKTSSPTTTVNSPVPRAAPPSHLASGGASAPSSLSARDRYLHSPFTKTLEGPVIAWGPCSIHPALPVRPPPRPPRVVTGPSSSMIRWLSCAVWVMVSKRGDKERCERGGTMIKTYVAFAQSTIFSCMHALPFFVRPQVRSGPRLSPCHSNMNR